MDDELINRIRDDLNEDDSAHKDWREEARSCYDYVAGRPYSEEELEYLRDQGRPAIVFNRVGPIVDAVVGHQANNATETRYLPREMGDVKTNEVLSGAVGWADDVCDAEDELEDCWKDLVVTGMGSAQVYMDYTEDLDGKLVSAERFSPLELRWDPNSRRRNLADAKWIGRQAWWDREEAILRWPELAEIDVGQGTEDLQSGGIHVQPTTEDSYESEPETSPPWRDPKNDQVLITQYQYWELEPVWRALNPMTGQIQLFTDKEWSQLEEQGLTIDPRTGQEIQKLRQRRKAYKEAFSVGPHLLEHHACPCPKGFTLRVVTGHRDETNGTWYGLVRNLRDPQKWSTKLFSDIHEMVVSNRRGGAFYEEGALVNPARAEEEWSSNNPLIAVKTGALSQGKIQERQPPRYPEGMDRLLQFAITAIPDVSGINMELMGLVNRDQPGILEAQRKRAALTIMGELFSNFGRFMRERGRIVLYFIQHYMSDGRLVRILGEDGNEQYVKLAKQKETATYDVIVDEAPASPNRKEEVYMMLRELLPLFLQAGLPIPPDVLQYTPLPSTLTAKWIKLLQPPDPNSPEAQQQAQQAKQTMDRMMLENQELAGKVAKLKEEVKKVQSETVENMAQARDLTELEPIRQIVDMVKAL